MSKKIGNNVKHDRQKLDLLFRILRGVPRQVGIQEEWSTFFVNKPLDHVYCKQYMRISYLLNKPPTDLSNNYHEALPVLQRPLADFSRLLSTD